MNYQFEETRMPCIQFPARVVDGLLSVASGSQLKVLLFLLRFDKMAHSAEEIARFCGIRPEEVADAIDFWVKERVFAMEQGKLRLISAVKTVQPKELPRVQPTVILAETDEDFRQTIAEIQRIAGKPLNSLMISLFYNMAENLHFSAEMIVQLAAYCVSIDKFSYRYMETVAADWYDSGIDTFEKAEAKIHALEQSRKLESRLAKAFGIQTAFSAKQRESIESWAARGIGEELILEAYNRCMDHKGKMSFAYIGKILDNWYQLGYKRVSDIQEGAALSTERKQHSGLSELEKMGIGMMQSGGNLK